MSWLVQADRASVHLLSSSYFTPYFSLDIIGGRAGARVLFFLKRFLQIALSFFCMVFSYYPTIRRRPMVTFCQLDSPGPAPSAGHEAQLRTQSPPAGVPRPASPADCCAACSDLKKESGHYIRSKNALVTSFAGLVLGASLLAVASPASASVFSRPLFVVRLLLYFRLCYVSGPDIPLRRSGFRLFQTLTLFPRSFPVVSKPMYARRSYFAENPPQRNLFLLIRILYYSFR